MMSNLLSEQDKLSFVAVHANAKDNDKANAKVKKTKPSGRPKSSPKKFGDSSIIYGAEAEDTEKMSNFCLMEVYKKTLLTPDERATLKKLSWIMLAITIIQFANGIYLYSVTNSKYQPRRGSWYVGICSCFVMFGGFFATTHTSLIVNISFSMFSALIALAGALLDMTGASVMIQLNACLGNGKTYFADSGDPIVAAALAQCTANAAGMYNWANGIAPDNDCICTAGEENECVTPYSMSGSSCKPLASYGGLLLLAFLLCIMTFVLNVVMTRKEIHILNARALQVRSKYHLENEI